MPEGPEIASIKASLQPHLEGKTLSDAWVSELPLRAPFDVNLFANSLRGRAILAVKCRGKVLWLECAHDLVLAFRLGMSGRVLVCQMSDPVLKHTHVRIKLKDQKMEIRYVDPRRFGSVSLVERKPLDALAPDPFS